MQPDGAKRALRCLLLLLALAGAGCAGGLGGRGGNAAAPVVDRSAAQAQLLASHLETLARLVQGAPDQQAEIIAAARVDYELAPTASHQLRYALALATNGHGGHDPALAQRLLREILAQPEALQPAERALALLELQSIEKQLALAEEIRRLQTDVVRSERERATAASRRLQAEIEENARLRRELDEARAKLDAIANIERSISERKPQPPAQQQPPPP